MMQALYDDGLLCKKHPNLDVPIFECGRTFGWTWIEAFSSAFSAERQNVSTEGIMVKADVASFR